jgi:hypothetical protein
VPQRQFTSPLLIRGHECIQMQRVPFTDRAFDEDWLQRLLYEHPAVLPVHELEPVFSGLIPVARELPTPAGPVDLLYVNAQGFLILAETKLWRNPEARRSVVAQIIDYAKEMARWSYRDLTEAVRRGVGAAADDPLVELVRGGGEEFDEADFIDSVSRNLRLGRFLLLVVGDGIREDVEHMAEFLQKTPHLAFTLGLVELGLYRLSANDTDLLLAQPRILARTQEIVRAVVEIKVPIRPEDVVVDIPTKPTPSGRSPITEDKFYEELGKINEPDAVALSRWVLDNAASHGLQVKWGEAGPLLQWLDEDSGQFFTFGQLCRDGRLGSTERFFNRCRRLGLPERIADEYATELMRLVPGAYVKKAKHEQRIAFKGGDAVPLAKPWPVGSDALPLAKLWAVKEAWLGTIGRTIARIQKHLNGEA